MLAESQNQTVLKLFYVRSSRMLFSNWHAGRSGCMVIYHGLVTFNGKAVIDSAENR